MTTVNHITCHLCKGTNHICSRCNAPWSECAHNSDWRENCPNRPPVCAAVEPSGMPDHYRIMGNYEGTTEEVDSTDDKKEAIRLRGEYQLAFGSSWSVWVEVQTFDDTGTLDECYKLEDT
jgi:hypothetical protein